jgi:predicted SAM-dependent methyltransferase
MLRSLWHNLGRAKPAQSESAQPRVPDRFVPPHRLHLACGNVHKEGWINVDIEATPATDLVFDLVDGLPFPDASCELVYHEHFLEHLAPDQGVRFLGECRRVLQPGGWMRIAMPDLDDIIRRSADGTWREQVWLKALGDYVIPTRAEMINMAFRDWGHRWLYDREELERRLREAGFSIWHFAEWGRSSRPTLCGMESRAESILLADVQRD